jgi:hypothetical protein
MMVTLSRVTKKDGSIDGSVNRWYGMEHTIYPSRYGGGVDHQHYHDHLDACGAYLITASNNT